MNDSQKHADFKSGFVAIVGAPNAGKSTLLNRILGQKISITSKKPQTTRDRILGIFNRPCSQMIFLDTPGIHRPKGLLNRKIVEQAFRAVKDVDIILFIKDMSSRQTGDESLIIEQLKKERKDVILALNKIDLVKKHEVFRTVDRFRGLADFNACVPVSAEKGTQVPELLEEIENLLPGGPPLFPEDTLTDASLKFLSRELVREKIFRLTGMEIPYSSAVTVDAFEEESKLIRIHATIHVTRKSQKGILLGKNGAMIKQIGEKARGDIEKMAGKRVYLELFVRVTRDWNKSAKQLDEMGY
ncbi:MAG: GTPase Era [Desulfobacteraceae bacterium]